MSSRIWLRIAEIIAPMLLVATIVLSWQADRRDRAQLAAQLAAAKQTIVQATASQHDRDNLLSQTLAQLAAQKQSAITPAQVIKEMPGAIELPLPITLRPDSSTARPSTDKSGHVATTATKSEDAVLPADDLKPLYDFALDCKACQAKLAASQSDLADEKTKSAALTKERDQAVAVAKGGSALRRIARTAKWFALGALAGAVAAKAAH